MNVATPIAAAHHACGFHFEPGDLDPLASKIFLPSGADTVHARAVAYESVIDALAVLISRYRSRRAEIFHTPPATNQAGPEGRERSILTPLACHAAYSIAAERGAVPEDGYIFDVAGDCAGPRPSARLNRFQGSRMQEYLRIGTPPQVREFRQAWIARARTIAGALELSYTVDAVRDDMAGPHDAVPASQRQDVLKFELRVPISSEKTPTACMSFSDHRDHFSTVWRLQGDKDDVMHTGCVAFGMDQLAVALFAAHGTRIAGWPDGVRETLKL